MKVKKLVYGVGINDSEYKVTEYEYTGGKNCNGVLERREVWRCPFYKKWTDMLARCYSKNKAYAYVGVTVCEEWLLFSNFRKWMVVQEESLGSLVGLHLDKDLLVIGNKVYSSVTCVFIEKRINDFVKDNSRYRGTCMLGAHLIKSIGKFKSECSNPLSKEGDTRGKYIGYFDTEIEAHLAWKKRKHEYSYLLAGSKYVTDGKVKKILLTRYKNYTRVEEHLS